MPHSKFLWQAHADSVIGFSHHHQSKPNQDAYHLVSGTGSGFPIILTIADGHGSDRAFRSQEGSRIAVEVSAELLKNCLDKPPEEISYTLIYELTRQQLPMRLVQEWQEKVNQHLDRNPFSEQEEKFLLSDKDTQKMSSRHSLGQDPMDKEDSLRNYYPYGTTLLGVAITASFILYLQIGDGDILCLKEDGTAYRPIPKDSRLFGNETTSLCLTNAWSDLTFQMEPYGDEAPAMIFLATDGYSNSFASEADLQNDLRLYFDWLKEDSFDSIKRELPQVLTRMTKDGSGDDITVGIIRSIAQSPENITREVKTGNSESEEPQPTEDEPEVINKMNDSGFINSHITFIYTMLFYSSLYLFHKTTDDIPRRELKKLIDRFGVSLSADRLRCLEMLKDVCGEHKKEIAGIMAALDEGIPNEILKSDLSMDISRRLLSRKLEDNRGIAEELAVWAVDTWAIALESHNTSTSTTAGVTTNSTLPRKRLQPPQVRSPQPKRNESIIDGKTGTEDQSIIIFIFVVVLGLLGLIFGSVGMVGGVFLGGALGAMVQKETERSLNHKNRGDVKFDSGDYQGALNHYRQCVSILSPHIFIPDGGIFFYNRGVVKCVLGDKSGATADFNLAIKLGFNHTDIYMWRGIARLACDDQWVAIRDFDKYLSISSSDAFAYFSRGKARSAIGHKQSAVSDFSQAIRLSPDYSDAYKGRGEANYDLGDKQWAIADYGEVIALNPDDFDAFFKRGYAKSDLGDKEGAISDYNEAIRLKPDYTVAYNTRGIAKFDLGDQQGAIADYNLAIYLQLDYAFPFYNRGVTKNSLGDKQGALDDLRRAAELYHQQGNNEWYNYTRNKIIEIGG